ncbi:MAG TPA: patatin-like phospholipase family protein [Chitinophagaceae bacterium]|nr:patatin-like phospholipase family protein [Chitinophagaceae bacterium]
MKKFFVFALSCFLSFALPAQENSIKNIVFEGAGIRGIAYCGAIQALEDRGMLPAIEKVGGTSAGAITALCVSLGYSADEITDLLYSTKFSKFNDGRFFFIGGINRVNKYFGWYRGEKFLKWIEKIIEKKTGNANISLEELYNKGFKDLYITATILNEQRLVILSRKTYPRMRVKDAIRISISIPFYFEAVFIDKEGKTIRHPKNKEGLDIMIDGGFVGNFPIKIFDSVVNKGSSEPVIVNNSTLGFRVDNDKQIENDKQQKNLAAMRVTNLKEYGRAFYNIIIENLNRQTLSDSDWKRTVSISDGAVRPRIRKLSKAEITVLIENGRAATNNFFKQ